MPMPKRSPFLDMTNLYNEAGSAEKCAEMLVSLTGIEPFCLGTINP